MILLAIILSIRLELFSLTVIVCLVFSAKLVQASDIVLWLGTNGIRLEPEAFVSVQRFIDLVELLGRTFTIRIFDDTFSDEYRIILGAIFDGCLAVLGMCYPIHGLPS